MKKIYILIFVLLVNNFTTMCQDSIDIAKGYCDNDGITYIIITNSTIKDTIYKATFDVDVIAKKDFGKNHFGLLLEDHLSYSYYSYRLKNGKFLKTDSSGVVFGRVDNQGFPPPNEIWMRSPKKGTWKIKNKDELCYVSYGGENIVVPTNWIYQRKLYYNKLLDKLKLNQNMKTNKENKN